MEFLTIESKENKWSAMEIMSSPKKLCSKYCMMIGQYNGRLETKEL